MSIVVRKPKSNFTPAPEGLHVAVCADVWEPWVEERPDDWGGGLREVTRIVWQIEETNPKTNQPHEVSQLYTMSLHPKSKLSAHLEAWRGRPFTDAEREGFDIEKLIGVSCQLQIIHVIKDTATYANVQAIVPLGKNQVKLRVSEDYVRRKDKSRSDVSDETGPVRQVDDSEVPF